MYAIYEDRWLLLQAELQRRFAFTMKKDRRSTERTCGLRATTHACALFRSPLSKIEKFLSRVQTQALERGKETLQSFHFSSATFRFSKQFFASSTSRAAETLDVRRIKTYKGWTCIKM